MRSLGRNNNTQSGGGQKEQTGACGLKFTLHRRCKQEARDGGADGSVRREWEAERIVSTPFGDMVVLIW